jgi:tetratricopeptide (TPR) repeat protein
MKKILLVAASLLSLSAMAQIKMPQPSPTQKITQDFGLGSIELVYSRPSLKGRKPFQEKGNFHPTGEMWRTGANSATKIRFTDAVMVGGKLLDSGMYVIYTIPGNDYWEIIFNKGITNSGLDGYKTSEDVHRFNVKPAKMSSSVETFTFQFADVKAESCELHLMWAKTAVAIPMSVNVKDKIRAQVEKALSASPVNPASYSSAATFYYEWDKDLDKALSNINKATDANPKALWLYLQKARIQKDLGDKVSATASAQKCVELATEAKNNDYVRMANELLKGL